LAKGPVGTGDARETFAPPARQPGKVDSTEVVMTTRIALILLALATASTPALARHYRHWHGNYNYGGPHFAASDYYHNSRQLVGTR
jgi:hypothetical protein